MPMKLTPAETGALRDQLFSLNPDTNPHDRQRYEQWRSFYIGNAEGRRAQAYKDVLGFVTVGIGFNMDRPEAHREWQAAFGQKNISFEDVYQGHRALTDTEINTLFAHGLAIREKALSQSYHLIWSHLKPNERLATESAYYNGTGLVQGPSLDKVDPQPPTRYYGHLKNYALESDAQSLVQAVEELRERSNRHQIRGLALRRSSEAELLSSFKVPGFETAA